MNLGNDVIAAIDRLKETPHFSKFREAFSDFVHGEMHKALDVPADVRIEATARVRAFRDLLVAFESAATGSKAAQIDKVVVVNKGKSAPVPGKGALPTGEFKGNANAAPAPEDPTHGLV
jgi:hypothetical protein